MKIAKLYSYVVPYVTGPFPDFLGDFESSGLEDGDLQEAISPSTMT
jgi:hypothetical protein